MQRQRTRVWRDAARPRPVEGAISTTITIIITASGRRTMIDQNTLKSIEDLHRLKNDGIITEEEFERSKQKLLFGGKPAAEAATVQGNQAGTPLSRLFGSAPARLPSRDDGIGWITLLQALHRPVPARPDLLALRPQRRPGRPRLI